MGIDETTKKIKKKNIEFKKENKNGNIEKAKGIAESMLTDIDYILTCEEFKSLDEKDKSKVRKNLYNTREGVELYINNVTAILNFSSKYNIKKKDEK